MDKTKTALREIIPTPFFFSVGLTYSDRGLVSVEFINERKAANRIRHRHSRLTDLFVQYFKGKAVRFPRTYILPELSEFTKEVLCACAKIPYGKIVSYKQLAELSGRPKAARAVGNAMRRNPLPIIIPCHRVIGSDGGLHGFMGTKGVAIKRCLLALERRAPLST